MLWPLSWDEDNWGSMFHTLEMNNHALTVVIRRWQLTEQISYLWGEQPCSVRCHGTMATDRAWLTFTWGIIIILWPLSWGDTTNGSFFILKGCITVLRSLPWDDDNWRSMSHTLGMNKHALSTVMRWWQLTAYDSYLRGYNHTLTVVMRR